MPDKNKSLDRCLNPFYSNTLLLIVYLSAIETLMCHTEFNPFPHNDTF